MSHKYALVLGAAGQVGSYMVDYLLEKGFVVNAGVRRTSNNNISRLSEHTNNQKLLIHEFDLTDYSSVYNLVKNLSETQGPQLIFNFAAMSHVHTSFNQPLYSQQSAIGHLNILEVLREFKNYYHRLWFAGSSVGGTTPILIKKNNEIFQESIENLFMYYPEGSFECLTVDKNYKTKWSPVSYVFRHKADNIYRLRGSGGLDIDITGNHSVIVFDENANLIEKRVDELSLKDLLISFKNNKNEKYCNKEFVLGKPKNKIGLKSEQDKIIINNDIMRLIGYYMAEGNIDLDKRRNKRYRINFTFHIKEKKYTDDIKEIVYKNFKIKTSEKEREKNNTRCIRIGNKQISDWFFNEFGTGCFKKKIPSWFYDLNSELFYNFLRGYIGDAYVTNKFIKYTSVNKKMIENICYLCKMNNINCSISKRFNKEHLSPNGKKIKGSCCYDLIISKKSSKIILPDNYIVNKGECSEFGDCIDSKIVKKFINYNKQTIGKNKLLNLNINDKLNTISNSDLHIVRIKSIEKLNKNEYVYDLNVPETQMFVGGNFPILLHNSEMFGSQVDSDGFQRITTPMIPNSPYAVAKLAAYHNTRLYRESYNLWACSGVMFNSESERRGPNFVTRKITNFFAEYQFKNCPSNMKLQLGNCKSKRDWTHALDSVDAIYKMITNREPKDYVISSMETHSVEDFYNECYNLLTSNIKSPVDKLIEINPKFFRPNEVPYLKGDSTPLRNDLGWDNKIKFKELVKRMYTNEYYNLRYNDEKR